MYRSYSRVDLVRSSSFSKSGPRQPSTHLAFPLGRSTSSVLSHSRTPPTDPAHTRQAFGSTAYYADRFPHVRYSHGYDSDTRRVGLISSLPSQSRAHYSTYGGPYAGVTTGSPYPTSRSRTEPALSHSRYGSGYGGVSYNSYRSPHMSPSYDRPKIPQRDYVGHMNVDHAVDLYRNKYLTSSTLSKYFLTSRPSEASKYSSYSCRPSRYESSYGSPGSTRSSYGSSYGSSSYGSSRYGSSSGIYTTPTSYSRYSRRY